MSPVLLFRVEVPHAIYFGPVNLFTARDVPERISLGIEIAARAEGVWMQDVRGVVYRGSASLALLLPRHVYLRTIIIDLKIPIEEVRRVRNLLANYAFGIYPLTALSP